MRGLWLRTGRLRGDVKGTACPYPCSQRSCDFQLRLFRTVVAIAKGVPDNTGDMIIHLGKASLGPLNVLGACGAPA